MCPSRSSSPTDQTHRRPAAAHGGVRVVVEGDVDDYVVAANNIFGTEFAYNQYHYQDQDEEA